MTDTLDKVKHFLRLALRADFRRKALRNRPHLEGLDQSDLELSRKHTMRGGHPYRSELIAVLCDGLWLNRKKYLAGLIPSPACPCCGHPQENTEHLFYECKHWEPYWGDCLQLREVVRKLPPCASLCAHAMQEMDSTLRKQWGKIQTLMAHIVHDRMDMNGEERKEKRKDVDSRGERRERGRQYGAGP